LHYKWQALLIYNTDRDGHLVKKRDTTQIINGTIFVDYNATSSGKDIAAGRNVKTRNTFYRQAQAVI